MVDKLNDIIPERAGLGDVPLAGDLAPKPTDTLDLDEIVSGVKQQGGVVSRPMQLGLEEPTPVDPSTVDVPQQTASLEENPFNNLLVDEVPQEQSQFAPLQSGEEVEYIDPDNPFKDLYNEPVFPKEVQQYNDIQDPTPYIAGPIDDSVRTELSEKQFLWNQSLMGAKGTLLNAADAAVDTADILNSRVGKLLVGDAASTELSSQINALQNVTQDKVEMINEYESFLQSMPIYEQILKNQEAPFLEKVGSMKWWTNSAVQFIPELIGMVGAAGLGGGTGIAMYGFMQGLGEANKKIDDFIKFTGEDISDMSRLTHYLASGSFNAIMNRLLMGRMINPTTSLSKLLKATYADIFTKPTLSGMVRAANRLFVKDSAGKLSKHLFKNIIFEGAVNSSLALAQYAGNEALDSLQFGDDYLGGSYLERVIENTPELLANVAALSTVFNLPRGVLAKKARSKDYKGIKQDRAIQTIKKAAAEKTAKDKVIQEKVTKEVRVDSEGADKKPKVRVRLKTPKETEVTNKKPKVRVKLKPQPTTKVTEKKVVGLHKKAMKDIRKIFNLDTLDKNKRVTFRKVLGEVKEQRLQENASAIADSVFDGERITDHGFVAMVLRTAELDNLYQKKLAEYDSLSKKVGSENALNRLDKEIDYLVHEMDHLTRAADLNTTQAGRALVFKKLMIDPERYTLANIQREASKRKGGSLSVEETKEFKKLEAEYNKIIEKEKELRSKAEDRLLESQKALAEEKLKKATRGLVSKKISKTRQDKYKEERTVLNKKLNSLLSRTNSIIGVDPEIAYVIGRLAENYVKSGLAKSLDQIVETVRKDIPDAEELEVYEAYTKVQPRKIKQAQKDISALQRSLKTEAKLLVDIDKAIKGEFTLPKVTNKKPTPGRIQDLRLKLKNLHEHIFASLREAKLKKNALQRIADLDDQLNNMHRKVRKQKAILPEEVQQLNEQVKLLRTEIRAKDQIAVLDDYARLINEGKYDEVLPHFHKPKIENKKVPVELEKVLIEKRQKMEDIRLAVQDIEAPKASKTVQKSLNTLRTLKAWSELSTALKQGGIAGSRMAFTGRLKKLTGFLANSFKAAFSEANYEQLMVAIEEADHHYKRQKAGLFIADISASKLNRREEIFMDNYLEQVPVLKKLVRGGNRATSAILNLTRVEAFDNYLKHNSMASDAELSEVAHWINVHTGRGDIGSLGSGPTGALTSAIIFAPRFSVSRFQTLYKFGKQLLEGTFKATPSNRRLMKEMIKDMAAFYGSRLGLLSLMSASGYWDVNLTDPRDSDWLKPKRGNTRIDVFAGFQQSMRFLARIGAAVGDETGLTGKDLRDIDKKFNLTEDFFRLVQYKVAPAVSLTTQLLSGKDFSGKEQSRLETLVRAAIPIYWESLLETAAENSNIAAATAGPGFLGFLDVNTYSQGRQKTEKEIGKYIRSGDKRKAYETVMRYNIEHPESPIKSLTVVKGGIRLKYKYNKYTGSFLRSFKLEAQERNRKRKEERLKKLKS